MAIKTLITPVPDPRGVIMASGHVYPPRKARAHGRTDQACFRWKALADREPSTHGRI